MARLFDEIAAQSNWGGAIPTVVDVNDVAQLVWGDRIGPDLDHMRFRTPWSIGWIEFKLPADGGRVAVLLSEDTFDPAATPPGVYAGLGTHEVSHILKLAIVPPRTRPGFEIEYWQRIYLRSDGYFVDWSEETAYPGRHGNIEQRICSVAMLAVGLANVRGVTLEAIDPPPRLQKARQKKGKPALHRYHVLTIPFAKDLRRRLESADVATDDAELRPFHLCGGHFGTYSEGRPLFGKLAGTFWCPPHARGSQEHGTVSKDYKLDGPSIPTEEEPVVYSAAKDPDYETTPELIWPRGLVHDDMHEGPKLVYLDLMHWIALSQALVGHASGELELYDACLAARRAGSVLFPLSVPLMMEVTKIKSPEQGRHLANVMEPLSGYNYLVGRDIIVRSEIEAALDAALGTTTPPPCHSPVGPGIQWATGQQLHPALTLFHNFTQRKIIEGAPDELLPTLEGAGCGPEALQAILNKRVADQNSLRKVLTENPEWRLGRLRDVVASKELCNELSSDLASCLLSRGFRTLNEVVGEDRQALRNFARSMPSCEVAVHMKTHMHRQLEKRWDGNTIFDIDALSQAFPYSDIVVTEKHATHVLESGRLPQRMNTVVLRRLRDLLPYLDG